MQQQHNPEQIAAVIEQVREIVTEYYTEPDNRPAFQYNTKDDMSAAFFEPNAPKEGIGLEAALDEIRTRVLPTSVKTWHPRFLNQMFPGASFPSLIGEMMASMLNPTMATWEMAPSATLIERSVVQWMTQIMGMPEGSGGVLLPGGSLSNVMALMLARNTRLDPDIAHKGLQGVESKGVILCSAACHYSISNAGNMLGLGSERVIKVAVNECNEMLIDDLMDKLDYCSENGLRPFALVATMGITVTGCFDPLHKLAPICRERDIHLHVDAAFGGMMGLSKQGPEIFSGIEYADSVIWDAHKWMHVPLTCTALMVPNPAVLKQVFASGADYLFHEQEVETELTDDLGGYTLLCGKRFDGLCLWMLFKAFGEQYFRDMINQRMEVVGEMTAWFDADEEFEASYRPRSPLMCFRYNPPAVVTASQTYRDRLHRFVREEVKKRGVGMFNIARIHGVDHFRMVLVNDLTTADDLKAMLNQAREIAREYVAANPPA